MNTPLRWFRALIWLGVIINMSFAIPALIWPNFLNTSLGLPAQALYPWLNNAGMLLIGISLFYIPAGLYPQRWFTYSWLCVISRLIAVIFWIWLDNTSGYPDTFLPLLISDATMFVALAVSLQMGLPPEGKFSISNVLKLIAHGIAALSAFLFRKPLGTGVAVVLIGFLGYTAWDNLLRKYPDPVYENAEEHYKYGAIGLAAESRIPLYLFEVLPEICAGMQNGVKQWSDLGFVFEPGMDTPIGLAKRHIGYPSVEGTCSLCHTGEYRKAADDVPVPMLASPANTLDLQRFQWFLYDCAASDNFTSSKIMAAIEQRHELGMIESLYYRFAIIPIAKLGLKHQASLYSWQKLRPRQGPGRTDTFNPTKIAVFGFPDDSTIGTVDLPQIWNQKPREGMWLHWDGNNNAIRERNYAAAMAIGATPDSVLVDSFTRITDWLLTKQPDPFPYPIDQSKADAGKPLWDQYCADCHAFGKTYTGQVTTSIQELGTDRYRLDSFTVGLVDKFHTFKKPPFDFEAYRKTQSYSNTPLDGVWARAPYLHNGSVPTLWDLLQLPDNRPKSFYKGYSVYDEQKAGFISAGAKAESQGWLLDTSLLGNGNGGHLYGTDLSDQEKWELIEFMKTL